MKLADRHRQAVTGAGVIAVVLIVAAVVLLTRGNSPQVQPQADGRPYTAQSACLLTGPAGIATAPASIVWAGMEDAAALTHARVTYLTVSSPDTASSAIPYANSLIGQHCGVVLAIGASQTGALVQIAPRTPKTQFVVIGNTAAFDRPNLRTIGLSPDTRSQVNQTVASLVNS